MARALHAGIFGRSGSGKTTLARYLARRTPRAIILDRTADPMWDEEGAVFTEIRPAFQFVKTNTPGDFHVVYRAENVEHYRAWMGFIYDFQKKLGNGPPVAVFVEEAGMFSSSHDVPDTFEKAISMGRRHRLSIVSVAQRDTMIHPSLRANQFVTVVMQSSTLSSDFKSRFDKNRRETIRELEVLTPGTEPTGGTHYVTDPPGVDVAAEFVDVQLA